MKVDTGRRIFNHTGWAVALLVLALAGSATAGALITGGDVRNSSLTGRDVRNESLTKRDFRGSVRGPIGPQGPAGPAGTAFAYAQVNFDGTLNAANSKNISRYFRDDVVTNYYCFDVPGTPKNAVATLEGIGGGEIVVTFGDPYTSCDGAVDVVVQTFDSAGGADPRGFFVAFN